ncbi:MAG: SpoIIE family protein phosphatase [Myxococcota bacterium]
MSTLESFSVNRPCRGEHVSGDLALVQEVTGGWLAALGDVLGHGKEAHALAVQIVSWLESHASGDVARLMERLHKRLGGSRGAALGLCFVTEGGKVQYVGTGNTALRRIGSTETRLVSRDGVVGHTMRAPHVQSLELEPDDLLLLYTDGVSDRFGLKEYPALRHHSVNAVARSVIKRFAKDYDDATCVALRYKP